MGGSSLATVLADREKFPYQFLTGPTCAGMVGMLLESSTSPSKAAPTALADRPPTIVRGRRRVPVSAEVVAIVGAGVGLSAVRVPHMRVPACESGRRTGGTALRVARGTWPKCAVCTPWLSGWPASRAP